MFTRIKASGLRKGMIVVTHGAHVILPEMQSELQWHPTMENPAYWGRGEVIDTRQDIAADSAIYWRELFYSDDPQDGIPRWTIQSNDRVEWMVLIYGPIRPSLDDFCAARADDLNVDWQELTDAQRDMWRDDMYVEFTKK